MKSQIANNSQVVLPENSQIIYYVDSSNMATELPDQSHIDDLNEDFLMKIVQEMEGPSTLDNSSIVNVVTQEAYPEMTADIDDLLTLAPADLGLTYGGYKPPATIEHYSPVSSPTSSESSLYTIAPESVIAMSVDSPQAVEEINNVVSPVEVFGERKRKRGRRPKSEAGLYPEKPRKVPRKKVYEIDQPLQDREQERKRLNAINAKRHRDIQKQQKQSLESQLNEVKTERDQLKLEVEALRKREADLSQQVKRFKQQAFSLVSAFGQE